nr:cyclic pyranopterin monophosphate synthase MoaC [Veillonella denticariosi]
MDLTHFDEQGNAWMVDVSDKDVTSRTAIAEGFIAVNDTIYDRIAARTMKKGGRVECGPVGRYHGGGETDESAHTALPSFEFDKGRGALHFS